MDPLPALLALLRVEAPALRAAWRVGSRVYGTAGPTSDEDFVVVLARKGQRQDLAFAPGLNVVLHGPESFAEALAKQSVFALECHFAPAEHTLLAPRQPFAYALDKRRLAASATERSEADWSKARKRFGEEPAASRKRLFHSLRVPLFAAQVARAGRLEDLGAARALHAELARGPLDDFAWYEERFSALRVSLCEDLARLARAR